MFLVSVITVTDFYFVYLKIDQDWGESEFLSFYTLPISPTGDFYRSKIIKLEKFDPKH